MKKRFFLLAAVFLALFVFALPAVAVPRAPERQAVAIVDSPGVQITPAVLPGVFPQAVVIKTSAPPAMMIMLLVNGITGIVILLAMAHLIGLIRGKNISGTLVESKLQKVKTGGPRSKKKAEAIERNGPILKPKARKTKESAQTAPSGA